MSDRKRLLYLILIMAQVALTVGGIAMYVLYSTAIDEQRERLRATVQSQAHLIGAVGRFTLAHSRSYPGGADAALLKQVRDAHREYTEFGDTGEFTLARRVGDKIVWMISHRHSQLEQPEPLPLDSPLAEPMRLALAGKSGTVIGPDYRGKTVVAAFQPMTGLDFGIVAKIDLAEVRGPFVRAALTGLATAILVVMLGSIVFLRVSNPMIRRLEELYETAKRELAERKIAEAKMVEFQRLAQRSERLADIGAITAEIVHDLGSPLSGLSMQAQLLRRRIEHGDSDPGRIAQSAERIVAITSRLDALIRDFTSFARDQTLNLEAVEIPQFLTSVVTLWESEALQNGVRLSVSSANGCPPIRADRVKLLRIFDNLVKNALEAIGDGPGRIVLDATSVDSKRVRISVQDTGPGVPDGIDVFALFKTTKPDGTGVGLAIVKQLAEVHGGSVKYSAASPSGTVFEVDLPCDGPVTPLADEKTTRSQASEGPAARRLESRAG